MPTSEGSIAGWVRINDQPATEGTLTVERDVVLIYGDHLRPDQGWTFVDAASHFHAYDQEGKTPTLVGRLRHIPCDGTCGGVCGGEGYAVTDKHCRICDEVIRPATVQDSTPIPVTGPSRWSVRVVHGRGAPYPVGHRVTVRLMDAASEVQAFGIAEGGGLEAFYADGRVTHSCTLLGVGELGRKGVRHAVGHATAG